jgi:hypothetical protein
MKSVLKFLILALKRIPKPVQKAILAALVGKVTSWLNPSQKVEHIGQPYQNLDDQPFIEEMARHILSNHPSLQELMEALLLDKKGNMSREVVIDLLKAATGGKVPHEYVAPFADALMGIQADYMKFNGQEPNDPTPMTQINLSNKPKQENTMDKPHPSLRLLENARGKKQKRKLAENDQTAQLIQALKAMSPEDLKAVEDIIDRIKPKGIKEDVNAEEPGEDKVIPFKKPAYEPIANEEELRALASDIIQFCPSLTHLLLALGNSKAGRDLANLN